MSREVPPPPYPHAVGSGIDLVDLADEIHAMRDEITGMRAAHRIGGALIAILAASVLSLGGWLVTTVLRNESEVGHLREQVSAMTEVSQALGDLRGDVRVLGQDVRRGREDDVQIREELRLIRVRIGEIAPRRR